MSLKKIINKIEIGIALYTGAKAYKKFIIITRSRTGSNFLISLLNDHPNIHALGEEYSKIGSKSTQRIWNQIFCKKPKNIHLVGFKLFYYHPLDSEDKSVWEIIQKDPEIRLIHLTRKNLLRTYVSREIAKKTDVWSSNESGGKLISKEQKKIELNISHCMADIENTINWQNTFKNRFENHKILEINYEQLSNDTHKTMHEVFDFLETAQHPVTSELKKQNTESLSELISNYAEVSKAFTLSGLKQFLND
ncbi:MAG: Stf0 family sulfotransferase [Flavobacteriales bacterium]